jgi:hypothetical protein
MTRLRSIVSAGLRRVSARLVLQQIGLALFVFLLWMLWLNLPDASVLEVIASTLVALVILAVAGSGETVLILRLCGRRPARGLLTRGTLLLVVAIALWFAWTALISNLRINDGPRAGHLNSQLPHSLRYFFTYSRTAQLLSWFWDAVEWLGTGTLAILVVSLTASPHPGRAISLALRSPGYWLFGLLGTFAAFAATTWLIAWTPGHGLGVEMTSLLLRLGAIVLMDGLFLGALLAILAECVLRADVSQPYATPPGTPAESQLRTADKP